MNRIKKYTDTQGNIIEYAYDANGNLITLTYPGGRQVQYQYDAADRLVKVTDWAGRITSYEYDPNGRLVNTTHPNGAETTRAYDDAGRQTQQKDVDTNNSVISQYDYTYDASGNFTEEKNSSENVTFTMDDAALTYAADNRLATYNGQAAVYDADGNMTYGPMAGKMENFTYDARGRLTGAGNTRYTYDAGNNRVQASDGVHQTKYIVNPNAPLSQTLVKTDEQNNQTFYVYGLGLIGQESPGGAYRTYHFDSRGSTIALTDEIGEVTDRFLYAPYGEMIYRSGNTATPFLFSGWYGVMTDASDLYYMRARYYNPVAKRFLSPDTLTGQVTNPQSQNLYTYCEGNPVIYVDPLGHNAIVRVFDKLVPVGKTPISPTVPQVAPHAPEIIDEIAKKFEWLSNYATIASVELIGKVEVPEGLDPGTCPFGNAMHQKIADWLEAKYIESEFQLNVKPGQKGIDVQVLENQNNLDFNYAEIKPMNVSGLTKFSSQMNKWNLPISQTVVFSYDYNGNIYLVRFVDEQVYDPGTMIK
ncbi:MAG: hypothetical protein M1489_04325 [Firmicutes bacterium]|nr:hypothetical protein [Bacillota bacterium]